jgi:hypothetical protein
VLTGVIEVEGATELVEGTPPAAELLGGMYPAVIAAVEDGVCAGMSVSVVDTDSSINIAAAVATGAADTKPGPWASAITEAMYSALIEVGYTSAVGVLEAVAVIVTDEEVTVASWTPSELEGREEGEAAIVFEIEVATGVDGEPIGATDDGSVSATEGAEELKLAATGLEVTVGVSEAVIVVDALAWTSAAETGEALAVAAGVLEDKGMSVAVADMTGV